jgi:subtilisin family serine protease
MSTKRVMAFYMHEHELDDAQSAMPQGESTASYVVGDLDDAGIKALRSRGLVVQVLEEAARPAWAKKVVTRRTARGLDAAGVPRAAPDVFAVPAAEPRVYVITFDRPLLPSVRSELANAGAELIESVGRNQYTARLDISTKSKVDALPFVRSTIAYGQADVEPATAAVRSSDVPAGSTMPSLQAYELLLHRSEDGPAVVQLLRAQNVVVEGHKGRKIRFYLDGGSSLQAQIRGLPQVASVDLWIKPKLHNDRARRLLGIDDANPNPGAVIAQTGAGQIVAVADTGLDQNHPDLPAVRIVGVIARGRPPQDASDPHGHGTHVAGSILGGGGASGGAIRGTAPDAHLFFQSVLDAGGGLGGLPWDLNELFEEAYLHGARIHNNSWGADVHARYTANSIEVDEFVANHPDMLIVISAGNDGSASDPINSAKGFVDWLSVGSPATSKNALTVGASQTDRTSGGYSVLSWGQAWPGDFPDTPVASERISGNPESMAAFSSRGPSDDRRIKPDVVAPGTDIVSARASTAPLSHFWGAFAGHGGKYAYMGGTSMSAPLVSGCAALVRQYYKDEHAHDASAALARATLINGTRALGSTSALADHPHLPNFHQGFGCVHMPSTLPNGTVPLMKLEFLDSYTTPAAPLGVTGDAVRYGVSVGSGHPFRVCLAWTDLPARALQNNLNLFVEAPDGEKFVGNGERLALIKQPDADNNIEIVRIPAPVAGDYVIKISASNLLGAGQHLALVVTGDLQTPLTVW